MATPTARILLVEDHADSARLCARLLRANGFTVGVALTATEARALAATEPFDLLLTDIGLPDGDGYALLADLNRAYGMRGIAVSGYGRDSDVHKGKDVKFAAHVLKPFDCDTLINAINGVVRT